MGTKTVLSKAQKIRLMYEALVEETKQAIIDFFALSTKGEYILNEEHLRCSEEDWENHYLKGIEVHSNLKRNPSLSIIIDDGEQMTVPIEDWTNLDDLVSLLDELEQKKYSPIG